MQEKLYDIKGYEGRYAISKTGEIWSYPKPKCTKFKKLKKKTDKDGYKRIGLYKNMKQHYYFIHRLVAINFIPNLKNKPCINHKDNNPANNSLNNLEWVTHLENNRYAWMQGRCEKTRVKGKNNLLNYLKSKNYKLQEGY